MGISDSGQWDIYSYDLSEKVLTNITRNRRGSHEDPKYSPSGDTIVFKETVGSKCRICEYTFEDKSFLVLKSSRTELSMPYYSKDGKSIYYVSGDGKKSRINRLKGGRSSCLYQKKSVESYYPIASGFGNILYFSRWYSSKNHADQIYSLNLKNNKATRLKLNRKDCDTSDFCEVSRKYAIVSTTGGDGSYDLHLVTVNGKKSIDLNKYCDKINTDKNELGADYREEVYG